LTPPGPLFFSKKKDGSPPPPPQITHRRHAVNQARNTSKTVNSLTVFTADQVEYKTVPGTKRHCQLQTMPSAVTEFKIIKKKMPDLRLQSQSRRELQSSELLCSEQRYVLTDVSE